MVAVLPLAHPIERYALELYAATKLRTGVFNVSKHTRRCN
jgi:hypothetical protein